MGVSVYVCYFNCNSAVNDALENENVDLIELITPLSRLMEGFLGKS